MSKEKLVNYYDAVEKLEKTHHIYPYANTLSRYSEVSDEFKERKHITYITKPDTEDISFVILDVSTLRKELKQLQEIADSQNKFHDELEQNESGDTWTDLTNKLEDCLEYGMRSKIDDWEYDEESIFEEITKFY